MIVELTLAELRGHVDAPALFAAAAAETGSPGAVRWPVLEALEVGGSLLVLAVAVDGRLVGYCAAAVGPELFAERCSCATLSLYVRPQHRGRWAWPLLAAVDAAGAARGRDLFRVQALPGTRLARALERRHGFRAAAIAFERLS